MDWCAFHVASIALFLAVVLGISATNLGSIRRTWTYKQQDATPRVSILVPARDEAANIERCVSSLLAQSYPNVEVIVLDDNSTDGTGDILARLQQGDPRLVVKRGAPKPAGWSGKHWACWQLSIAATGELLLFTDADTVHEPTALAAAVNALLAEDADLITVFPREHVLSLAEKLVVPVMHWAMSTFLPVAVAHRVTSPSLCLAIGQYMLYRKAAYDAVGGHEAIKSEILDDLPLAKRVKASGRRWRVADGSRLVSCRMYAGTREVVAGFTRNLFSAIGRNAAVYIFVWTWLAMVFLEPLVMLAIHAFVPFIPEPLVITYLACIPLSVLAWAVPLARFRFPLHAAMLYPATIIFIFVIAIRSLVHTRQGRIAWKGRAMEGTKTGGDAGG